VAEHPQVFASLTAPSFGPVTTDPTTTGPAAAASATTPTIPTWAP